MFRAFIKKVEHRKGLLSLLGLERQRDKDDECSNKYMFHNTRGSENKDVLLCIFVEREWDWYLNSRRALLGRI